MPPSKKSAPELPANLDLFGAPPPSASPAASAASQQTSRPPAALVESGALPVAMQQPGGGLPIVAAPSGLAALPQAGPATGFPPAPAAAQQPRVYRVVDLVRAAGRALEARFTEVWVEGEISNLRVPGHCYFTLKDAEAQLPVVLWKSDAARLKFRLTDGLQVRVRGRLSIFEGQGRFQLYADAIEPAGLGALQLAFEQLKRKLAAEGLFAAVRKRRLPYLPRRIGVATSPSGAAVRDIVRVIERRCPARILIAPCQVQGDAAPGEIVRALRWLERQPEIDLIIVGRGGGSIEDLWAFNDEEVARAIAACRVPVISAVGHEVDYTIADFVADQRAATPSQAAELAVPVHAELARGLEQLAARLARASRRSVGETRQGLDETAGRMGDLLRRSMQSRRLALGAAAHRLEALHPRARLARDRATLERLRSRLAHPPRERMVRGRQALAALGKRLDAAMQQNLTRRHRAFEATCGKLDALSPLKVLERGYALVRGPEGHVLTRAGEVSPGDALSIRLGRGTIAARVEQRSDDPDDPR